MGSEMIVSRPKSASRAVPVVSINMFALTRIKVSKIEAWFRQTGTYALEIPMNHSLIVNIDQPLGNPYQLQDFMIVNEARTGSSRESLRALCGSHPGVP